MIRHTLVVSDVHLCEIAPAGCRSPYPARDALPDARLAGLLDAVGAETRGGALEVVFNGDLFDFDAPRAAARTAPGAALPPPATHAGPAAAAQALAAILADHPVFVAAVARALARGARVVFVPGNHDAQLAQPAVRAALVAPFARAGARSPEVVAWFHRTPDGFHVEHGHQYIPLCALDDMAAGLEATLGTVASYYVPTLLGCDPYASDPFDGVPPVCDLAAAAARGGAPTALAGLLRALAAVRAAPARDAAVLCRRAAAETGADPAALARHAGLFAAKATLTSLAADRAWRGHGAESEARLAAAGAAIAHLHGARGVVFGHTHLAHGEWTPDGRFYGNAGAWAPTAGGVGPLAPASFVWLTTDAGGARGGTFYL